MWPVSPVLRAPSGVFSPCGDGTAVTANGGGGRRAAAEGATRSSDSCSSAPRVDALPPMFHPLADGGATSARPDVDVVTPDSRPPLPHAAFLSGSISYGAGHDGHKDPRRRRAQNAGEPCALARRAGRDDQAGDA